MYNELWKVFNKSVCLLNFYSGRNIQFFRATGFRFENYIISVFSREELERACYITIDFPVDDLAGYSGPLKIPVKELLDNLAWESNNGLLVMMSLPVSGREFRSIPPVKYAKQSVTEIGTPVAVISCSRQVNQLYIKTGMISSYLHIGGEEFIFSEASFEQGNSGSPLISADTGKVIGIVTDCFILPVQNYKILKKIIESNLVLLNNENRILSGNGNIDPAQIIAVNQQMIKKLAKEIYLTSQRNFSFAIPVETIIRSIKHLEHKKQISISNETSPE